MQTCHTTAALHHHLPVLVFPSNIWEPFDSQSNLLNGAIKPLFEDPRQVHLLSQIPNCRR